MSHQALPEPTLRRLPWYLACVSMLRTRGVEYVSTTALSRELNVDASQIAKDLSYINVRGRTRVGYEVRALEDELADFLGFGQRHNAVMIGVGSLGAALIADSGLARYGLNIVGGFDINPDLAGLTINGVPIYGMEELSVQRQRLRADIAIIAVPVDNAQSAADMAVAAGVKALWNFTPFRLRAPHGIVIQNTSIYAHLAVMYNRLQSAHPDNTDIRK